MNGVPEQFIPLRTVHQELGVLVAAVGRGQRGRRGRYVRRRLRVVDVRGGQPGDGHRHGDLDRGRVVGVLAGADLAVGDLGGQRALTTTCRVDLHAPTTPLNPEGCWDFWGYTGADYDAKTAPQMAMVRAMIDWLAGGSADD